MGDSTQDCIKTHFRCVIQHLCKQEQTTLCVIDHSILYFYVLLGEVLGFVIFVQILQLEFTRNFRTLSQNRLLVGDLKENYAKQSYCKYEIAYLQKRKPLALQLYCMKYSNLKLDNAVLTATQNETHKMRRIQQCRFYLRSIIAHMYKTAPSTHAKNGKNIDSFILKAQPTQISQDFIGLLSFIIF